MGLRRNVPACGWLLIEDLQDGSILQSVKFVNPFKRANDRLIDEVLPPAGREGERPANEISGFLVDETGGGPGVRLRKLARDKLQK